MLLVALWACGYLALGWMVLVFLSMFMPWLQALAPETPAWQRGVAGIVLWPVLWTRRLLPTVFFDLDLSPWMAMAMLWLIWRILIRALMYWTAVTGIGG